VSLYILMLEMLQELELTVGPLREDRCAERLHDLLHGDGLSSELVLCGAVPCLVTIINSVSSQDAVPDQSKGTHAHRLQVGISVGGESIYAIAFG
jgi:hypothetical protein